MIKKNTNRISTQLEVNDVNSFKYFLCRTSVGDFSIRRKREKIMHYLFFWYHEEERQTGKFAKSNRNQFILTESIIMD